jgi:hypothetical protein
MYTPVENERGPGIQAKAIGANLARDSEAPALTVEDATVLWRPRRNGHRQRVRRLAGSAGMFALLSDTGHPVHPDRDGRHRPLGQY